MIAIAFLFAHALCNCFKSQRRLEAEILVLRHQLNVLRQRTPRRRLHLRWIDRALFIWSDAPFSRPVQRTGSITSQALLGGLHHQYVRV